jgi:hypothetical protein
MAEKGALPAEAGVPRRRGQVAPHSRVSVHRRYSLFLGHKNERKTVKNFPIIRRFLSWYARCLESGVPKTEASNLLLLPSGSKSFRRFLTLLLALTATLVFGLGSAVTPATVSHNQSPACQFPARTPVVARIDLTTSSLPCTSAPRLQYPAAVSKPDNQNATGFRLEKQGGSDQRDWFQLVHKKKYADGRAGKWMDVTAGYGQVCQFESGIAKNTAELQHPGCAYLKASFSF